jgi:hypothetical protein
MDLMDLEPLFSVLDDPLMEMLETFCTVRDFWFPWLSLMDAKPVEESFGPATLNDVNT